MNEKIIKEERVGYLKSKMMLMQGVLQLSEGRIKLEAHKTGVSGFGILGAIIKRKVESQEFGFNVPLSDITAVTQGKHGVNKNVLVIQLIEKIEYRILVNDYTEWALLLDGEDILSKG